MNKSNLAVEEEYETDTNFVEDVMENKGKKIDNITNFAAKKDVSVWEILYKVLKRIIDIIGSLVGIVILIPVTLIIFLIRKFSKEDNGPLFYEQLRYGEKGKVFRLYKFRSMCVGAEKKLEEYLKENEEARKEFEETHKLQNDPRITKLGGFLRKTSLDELPQMINILKGEMSFVGPRPVIDKEVEEYGKNKEKFLNVKPGLTGYWQVNGRSNTTYEERMEMELYYVENCSLWLDIKIFIKTFMVVLKKEGAM